MDNASSDLTIKVRLVVDKLNADIKKLQTKISTMVKPSAIDKNLQQIDKLQDRIDKLVTPKQTPFAGWAMSIMFAGMAVQRVVRSIAKSTISTFQDINHSVEGNITSMDKLQGSFTYLKFVTGQALDPLMESLIPVVDKIADWVERNPELVAQLTELFAILGTAAAMGGAIILAKNGFGDLITIMKGVPLTAKAIKDYDWKSIGTSIQNGIGMVSIGIGFATIASSLKDFTEGTGEGTLRGALGTIAGVLETVGGLKLVQGAKGGVWMMAVGFTLDEIRKAKFFSDVTGIGGWFYAFWSAVYDRLIYKAKQLWAAIKGKEFTETYNFEESYRDALNSILKSGTGMDAYLSKLLYNTEIPSNLKALPMEHEQSAAFIAPVKETPSIAFYNATVNVTKDVSSDVLRYVDNRTG